MSPENKNAQREKTRIRMKTKHNLDSEMQTATVRAISRVAMKRKRQPKLRCKLQLQGQKTELI
jgi:hypothetical protein